ncbi:MAG: helix-hairpin-helix domain-containing protein [Clostridia bacterium]|nr:helix-hairpin-helix domain-containing protein [Clostridia bacterium]
MEKLKIILKEKYKYLIIVIVIICTIIGIFVYNLLQNQTEEEYNFLENEKEENVIIEKVIKTQMIKVHIDGEVVNPGVIEIEEGKRIIDAVNLAGGLTEEANIKNINLAYVLEDAMKIHIPNINDEEEEMQQEQNLKINLNTASVEELQKLDGIGSSMAQKIVNYRKENGKFNSIEDLKNISGIGDSKLDKIKNNIYVK